MKIMISRKLHSKSRKWLIFCLCSAALVLLFDNIEKFGVYINITDSAPKGIYLYDKEYISCTEALQKSSNWHYVVKKDKVPGIPKYVLPKSRYLLKSVVAAPGDYIEKIDNMIFVNGQCAENIVIREKNNKGIKIPAVMKYPCRVPEGFYFLGSRVLSGYDSRYWGLCPKEAIIGRVRLVYEFKFL